MDPNAIDTWKTTPPEPVPIAVCAHCEEEVYAGDPHYIVRSCDEVVCDPCWPDYCLEALTAERVN